MKPGSFAKNKINLPTTQDQIISAGTMLIIDECGRHPDHDWFEVARVRVAEVKTIKRWCWCEMAILEEF